MSMGVCTIGPIKLPIHGTTKQHMGRLRRLGISNSLMGILATMLLLGVSVAAPDTHSAKMQGLLERKNMIVNLDSEDPPIRHAAVEAILKSRRENDSQVATILERYVDAGERQGTVKDCMLLLGRLHATEYVPLIVKHITYAAFYRNTKRPQPLEDLHPAIPALIDMGFSSVKPVLERLKSEDDETLHRVGAAVLSGVLGQPWAILVVEDEQHRAVGPAKDRLALVLQILRAS